MNLREDGDPDEEEGKEMTRGTSVTQAPVQRHQCRPMGRFDSCALPPFPRINPALKTQISWHIRDTKGEE